MSGGFIIMAVVVSGGFSHNGEWWCLEGLIIMASGGVWRV